MYVIVKYDRKRPYLPVAVADSPAELARMLGIPPNRVHSSLYHSRETYARVWIDDDELTDETNDTMHKLPG